jgi:DNA-directed RNA polymerase I subunit RPA1
MTDAPAKAKQGKPKVAKPAQRYLSTMEVHKRLEMLFQQEQEMLALLYNSKPRPRNSKPLTADMFFMSTLLVPPNRYRPEVRAWIGQARSGTSLTHPNRLAWATLKFPRRNRTAFTR